MLSGLTNNSKISVFFIHVIEQGVEIVLLTSVGPRLLLVASPHFIAMEPITGSPPSSLQRKKAQKPAKNLRARLRKSLYQVHHFLLTSI